MAVILAIRTLETEAPAPLVSGLHTLLDSWPRVQVLIDGPDEPRLAGKSRAFQKLQFEDISAELGPGWFELKLGGHLADQRRTGRMELRFSVPSATILLYVVPTKLIDQRSFRLMCRDAEDALGRVLAWRSNDVFSGSDYASRALVPGSLLEERLDRVEKEALLAAAIRRNPLVERALADPGALAGTAEAGFLPENALVTRWASRRFRDLQAWQKDLDDEVRTLTSELEHRPPKRQTDFRDLLSRTRGRRERLERIARRVASLVRPWEQGVPTPVGPLVQRDHRLRALTAAFAPQTTLRPDESASQLSHYPPHLLNDVFELWCAVWILRILEQSGFRGTPRLRGTSTIQGICWRLTREHFGEEEEVWLHYEPNPMHLSFADTPPAHERDLPAEQWQLRELNLPQDRPVYGTTTGCSPDFILRIRAGGRRSLLIGDASLADPQYQTKRKPEAVASYLSKLRWLDGADIVRPDPMGGFLLLHGAPSQWEHLEGITKARDLTILALTRNSDVEAQRRFRRILARHLELAAEPTTATSAPESLQSPALASV